MGIPSTATQTSRMAYGLPSSDDYAAIEGKAVVLKRSRSDSAEQTHIQEISERLHRRRVADIEEEEEEDYGDDDDAYIGEEATYTFD